MPSNFRIQIPVFRTGAPGVDVDVWVRKVADGEKKGWLALDLKDPSTGKSRGNVYIPDGGVQLVKDITTLNATVPPPTTPPTPTPVPPTPTPIPGEVPVFDGSADKGFGSWTIQEWGGKVVIEDSPALPGHDAFKFNSQAQAYENGPRCEIAENYTIREGEDWWFGDVGFIRSGQPSWQSGNHTVWQWKNEGTGSPPLNLDIRSWYGLQAQAETPNGLRYLNIIPFSTLYDRPFRLDVNVKFSSNPSVGFFEVWVDGKIVIPKTYMATLYPGLGCYFKQGQYGNQATTYNYWHGVKRGKSRASVQR